MNNLSKIKKTSKKFHLLISLLLAACCLLQAHYITLPIGHS